MKYDQCCLGSKCQPSKHLPRWRSVEDVFSARFFVFQDVFKISSRRVYKTFYWRRLSSTSWRRLGRWNIVMLKLSWNVCWEALINAKPTKQLIVLLTEILLIKCVLDIYVQKVLRWKSDITFNFKVESNQILNIS